METERFLAFHPFASRAPFETWILPKEHQASFGSITTNDSKEFSRILKTILLKMYRALNDPDYNYNHPHGPD